MKIKKAQHAAPFLPHLKLPQKTSLLFIKFYIASIAIQIHFLCLIEPHLILYMPRKIKDHGSTIYRFEFRIRIGKPVKSPGILSTLVHKVFT